MDRKITDFMVEYAFASWSPGQHSLMIHRPFIDESGDDVEGLSFELMAH
jgi:hypothetical protein